MKLLQTETSNPSFKRSIHCGIFRVATTPGRPGRPGKVIEFYKTSGKPGKVMEFQKNDLKFCIRLYFKLLIIILEF